MMREMIQMRLLDTVLLFEGIPASEDNNCRR